MLAVILILCGIVFCIGYLASGIHAAVVCLLTSLLVVVAFSVFSPGFVILIGIVFGIAFAVGGLKFALLSLLVVAVARLFLRMLG